ncbi:MAG: S4 domain-containing protein, partial [Verrucomicrobiota bacterium]|nr:S4 domain-containing protein [Verrucomicrobiota bacterium]
MSNLVQQRIQKLIANSGYCSRREAERLLSAGCVRVNGKISELGDKACPGADI